jgi:hypothetical protein
MYININSYPPPLFKRNSLFFTHRRHICYSQTRFTDIYPAPHMMLQCSITSCHCCLLQLGVTSYAVTHSSHYIHRLLNSKMLHIPPTPSRQILSMCFLFFIYSVCCTYFMSLMCSSQYAALLFPSQYKGLVFVKEKSCVVCEVNKRIICNNFLNQNLHDFVGTFIYTNFCWSQRLCHNV